jgi:hypothetical protein
MLGGTVVVHRVETYFRGGARSVRRRLADRLDVKIMEERNPGHLSYLGLSTIRMVIPCYRGNTEKGLKGTSVLL